MDTKLRSGRLGKKKLITRIIRKKNLTARHIHIISLGNSRKYTAAGRVDINRKELTRVEMAYPGYPPGPPGGGGGGYPPAATGYPPQPGGPSGGMPAPYPGAAPPAGQVSSVSEVSWSIHVNADM